jgi:hypothetical protein
LLRKSIFNRRYKTFPLGLRPRPSRPSTSTFGRRFFFESEIVPTLIKHVFAIKMGCLPWLVFMGLIALRFGSTDTVFPPFATHSQCACTCCVAKGICLTLAFSFIKVSLSNQYRTGKSSNAFKKSTYSTYLKA